MQWLKSSFQPKGHEFNPFPLFFFANNQNGWNVYIEHINEFSKLCAFRKQLPWGKEN
jgi:hypothetical protein